jgi:hypothetical protein
MLFSDPKTFGRCEDDLLLVDPNNGQGGVLAMPAF